MAMHYIHTGSNYDTGSRIMRLPHHEDPSLNSLGQAPQQGKKAKNGFYPFPSPDYLAPCFARRFFSPFFPNAEPGPRLLKDNSPNPGEVGHTTRVYVPYSFHTLVWVILRPTRTIY